MKQFIFTLSAVLLLSGMVWSSEVTTDVTPKFPYAIEHHDLKLTLDLYAHQLNAVDLLGLKRQLPVSESIDLLLRRGLKVSSVLWNASKLTFSQSEPVDPLRFEAVVDSEEAVYYSSAQVLKVLLPKGARKQDKLELQIAYSGIVADSLQGADFSREYVAMQVTGIIDTAGVYLGAEGIYYPTLPGQTFTYSLEVTLPTGYKSVSEGNYKMLSSDAHGQKESWICDFPIDGFHIIAGKFQVDSIDYKNVKISTFFFPAEADLAQGYLDACKGYFDLYTDLLGPYPFTKFDVVDNFFATGYGMPSFTLLGSQVLRLPFIKSTSLGHEICHNWWGNSVYVDFESGNWCEGLTTYCADYLYKEKKSPADARDYRMGLLRDYLAYTHDSNDMALKDFRERHNPAQRAVGYGKSAMLFHMLRKTVGDDVFWKSLKKFYQDEVWKFASWDDISTAFETEFKDKLAWFFDQWVDRTGAPHLVLDNVQKKPDGTQWTVTFTLKQTQEAEPYRISLPVILQGASAKKDVIIDVQKKEATYNLSVGFDPVSLQIDPNFDVFRKPDRAELAPTLAEVFGAPTVVVVLPGQVSPEFAKAYRDMAEGFKAPGETYRVVQDSEINPDDYKNSTLLFLGMPRDNKSIPEPWLKSAKWSVADSSVTVLGQNYSDPGTSVVTVQRNPWNKELVVGYLFAKQAGDLAAIGRKVKHYGKYSYLVFKGSDNVAKGNWEPSDSPLTFKF